MKGYTTAGVFLCELFFDLQHFKNIQKYAQILKGGTL